MYGWTGKRIRVDLSKGEIMVESLTLDYLRKWIGGRGMNSEVVYHETKVGMDPFDPANPLCFGVGPLTGTFAPGSGRTTISARSPMTSGKNPRTDVHGHGDASMGSHWGAELKFAGYDQIIVKGKSAKPTWIWIDDDVIELRDASYLWGKDTKQTTLAIIDELGDPDIKVVCIGPAGEKLVRFAAIMNTFFSASGRTGMGAVAGSKNLKAITVRGSKPVLIAEPEKFAEACWECRNRIASDPLSQVMQVEGTQSTFDDGNAWGIAGAWKNHGPGYCPGLEEKFSGTLYTQKYLHSRNGCYACPVSCMRYTFIKEGPFTGKHFGGPEMESMCNLGPRTGTLDQAATAVMQEICNLYGIDTISAGSAISWAMDCYADGLLTENDTGGIPFRWGDTDTTLKVLEMIGKREGFGKLLGEGTIRAAKEVGRGTEKYVPHVRGLEDSACDPRIPTGFVLGYAMSTRGADHMRHIPALEFMSIAEAHKDLVEKVLGPQLSRVFWSSPKELTDLSTKPALCTWSERNKCVADLFGVCCDPIAYTMAAGDYTGITPQFRAATGVSWSDDELFKTAERVVTIERAHWNREGSARQDDTHIDRYFQRPVEEGPWKGTVIDRKMWKWAQSEYYRLHNWNDNGFVTPEKLEELDLKELIEDIEASRKCYEAELKAK